MTIGAVKNLLQNGMGFLIDMDMSFTLICGIIILLEILSKPLLIVYLYSSK